MYGNCHQNFVDSDGSGELDKHEVFMGVEQYCEARGLSFDSRVISRLWKEVDDNGDGVLDRQEFSIFLSRYCEAIGIALDDLAFVVLEQLTGQRMVCQDTSPFDDEDLPPAKPWGKIFSSHTTKRRPAKRMSWAELKIEAESATFYKENEVGRLAWIKLISRRIGSSRWSGASESMLPRRQSQIRRSRKINAKSLDCLFSTADEATQERSFRTDTTQSSILSSEPVSSSSSSSETIRFSTTRFSSLR
jgi:hypothetical protein